MPVIDEVVDLYRVEPGEFVAARAALVKQLRGEGRTDEARSVVKLRKPTVPAWALDQVAHDQPDLIEQFLAAGDALGAATAEVLGGDASNLRTATAAEQMASAAVLDAAAIDAAAIDAAGRRRTSLTTDHRERMAATLRAAIVDDEVRSQLVAGLLTADHEPPAQGFGHLPDPKPAAKATAGSARARLAKAPEPAPPKRKVRRVGTPSSVKRAPVDEVDARRQEREAEKAREEQAEQERLRERQRQQAELDSAASEARAHADELDASARQAEATAAALRADADAASAEAVAADRAAQAGPPDAPPDGPRTSRRVGRATSGRTVGGTRSR